MTKRSSALRRQACSLHVCFGKLEYSGDNAVGVALIGAEKMRRGE